MVDNKDGAISLEPKVPGPCPDDDPIYLGDGSGSVTTTPFTCEPAGLPHCPPGLEVNGVGLCPACLPPDAVMIPATERDPYYVDALAVAMESGDGTQAVRVTIDGNIPLVRPVYFRQAALPGVSGVPNTIRADIETHELEHQAINMYSTIPQDDGKSREVAVIDRFNNRWIIITSIKTDAAPIYSRLSPSHFARGRGVAPWWKTGFPDGSSSTGIA